MNTFHVYIRQTFGNNFILVKDDLRKATRLREQMKHRNYKILATSTALRAVYISLHFEWANHGAV